MQDRYAGDVGDYVKLALLLHLSGAGRKLGIAWYLHPDTTDGGHIRYLSDPARWRHLDYKLFDALAIAGGQRSTAALEAASVLDAIYTGERLDCTAVTYIDRDRWRHDWFKRVLRNLAECDLVFADPDNGLVDDRPERRRRAVFCKQIPLNEATELAKDRTAVIYHHNTRRRGGHDEEIRWWIGQLGANSIDLKP